MTRNVLLLPLILILFSLEVSAKTRIAVTEFKNKAGDSKCRVRFWSNHLGSGMADQLITELSSLGRFDIQERASLNKMYQDEHKLVNADKSALPQANKFRSAHYSIVGAITSFEMCNDSMGGKIDVGGLLGFKGTGLKVGAKRANAKVVIDMKVIDVERGSVLKSVRAEGTSASTNFDVDGDIKGADFGSEAFYSSPIGEATREAIKNAAVKLSEVMPERKEPAPQISAENRAIQKPIRAKGDNQANHQPNGKATITARKTNLTSTTVCKKDEFAYMCKVVEKTANGRYQVLYLNNGDSKIIEAKDVGALTVNSNFKVGSEVYVKCDATKYSCSKGANSHKILQPCKVVDHTSAQVSVICGRRDYTISKNQVFTIQSKDRVPASQKP